MREDLENAFGLIHAAATGLESARMKIREAAGVPIPAEVVNGLMAIALDLKGQAAQLRTLAGEIRKGGEG